MNKRLLLLFVMLLLQFAANAQNQASFSSITAGMSNRHLQRQAIWLANKRAEDYNWHETYYKAVIISHKWELDLDENGFLKGRKIHMELLGRMPDGKCVMTDFTFRQKVLPDETFSDKLFYDRVSDLVYVECE